MAEGNGSDQLRVAYQGERGAFSEEAARRLLGRNAQALPYRTFEEVFDRVSLGEADCAVAPIENSLAGSVHKNYDLLIEHDLVIIGETYLRIVHNLIAAKGVALQQVRRVYSHPVALAQCERFLRANPQIEAVPSDDTAGSVRMVIERGRADEAAIAGATAAAIYDAQIVLDEIEDNAKNFTRFFLLARPDHPLSKKRTGATGRQKTSLVFRITNRPGALFRALASFALRDIDMSKIESRPIEGRPWEYSFYLDVSGDAAEPRIGRALDQLAEMAELIRVLGSYPESEWDA